MAMDKKMSDEEVALSLAKLYFEQIARLGFKRKLDLDAIMSAYFYILDRLKKKNKELALIDNIVQEDEEKEKNATKKEILREFA